MAPAPPPPAHPRDRSLAATLLLLLITLASTHALEVEHRGGGPAAFLPPRFPAGAEAFASTGQAQAQAQAFSRAFSKAFSSGGGGGGGAHAFSNAFAGPQRLLLHGAFSESSSNASAEGAAAGATRSYSAAGTTADGRAFSESGAEADGAAASSSSSDSSSRAYSSSGGGGGGGGRGGAESGAASSSSSSSRETSSHAFTSSGGAGAERFNEASSHSAAKESVGLQGQRVSESSSQSSSSSSRNRQSSSSSFGASSGGERITHLAPVAEVPLLRPVLPVVEELLPDQLDAILLTTPVPIIEEVNLLPIHLQAGNQLTGHVASQENHQSLFHSSTSHLNDKRRKPIGPVRGYPTLSNEQHHRISSGSFEGHNRGSQNAHSGSSNSHHESNSHFSSIQNKEQPSVIRIGYHDNHHDNQHKQQQQHQYGSSEYHAGGSQTVQGQRVGVGQADSMKNILDAMQSFMKSSSHTESHRESHREAHRTNGQDGGAHRITYEAVVTGEAPEVLYQTQVNNVNGVKESFQQSGNSQGNTNINNIISQITREAAELNKQQRPYFVVKNEQSTSKFSETHGGLRPEHVHMRPHLENIDKVVHSEDNSQFNPDGSGFRPPINPAGIRNGESVTYSNNFHTESHSENSNGNNERLNGAGKFLMFNGHRYSSEDLAREFNRTRPTFPPSPSPSPTTPKPQIHQAEASTSSYGLQRHPNDKQNPINPHSPKTSNSDPKGGFSQLFGKHYHQFVPPALFDSREFSKFFFDHFRPGHPIPSAADFAQATANVPTSLPDRAHRPSTDTFPTNYFIYPGSIKHDSDIPEYVTRDMRNMKHGSSSSSSSSFSSDSSSSSKSESSSSSESESSSSSESGSNSSSESGSNSSSESGSNSSTESGSHSDSKSSSQKPRRPTRVQY